MTLGSSSTIKAWSRPTRPLRHASRRFAPQKHEIIRDSESCIPANVYDVLRAGRDCSCSNPRFFKDMERLLFKQQHPSVTHKNLARRTALKWRATMLVMHLWLPGGVVDWWR